MSQHTEQFTATFAATQRSHLAESTDAPPATTIAIWTDLSGTTTCGGRVSCSRRCLRD